ncbi:Cof-type HAD-IIB family hydrolase [Antribacter sp. KLBMP9083]|uniref:Cof-type HAD-IIB family hydrolase n=1 Tax=Antribacter soli TaxID=2910976 RepID=A0AA41QEE7_9MICO|nr:HAD family hydrolase [Antribacter soli]MCF4121280.1 Cof-type HAD-IIB family hydrolase [Antribacter soli]
MSARTAVATRSLVALDIDGTLLNKAGHATKAVHDAAALAHAAGHHLVPATGRSLVGLLTAARTLSLTDGWAVASNGAHLVRLDPTAPGGYIAEEAHLFAPRPVIRRSQELLGGVVVAVEDVGVGWRVSRRLPDGILNGAQTITSVADLCATPATRVALLGPGIRRFVDALAATGVTVTPAGSDWVDVVKLGVSKATTLEEVRRRLDVPSGSTVAVGDDVNDEAMLRWAARGVAMAHAPARVRHAATETTGTLHDDGAATVLRSLVPEAALDPNLSPLAAQLAATVAAAPSTVTLRAWHGTGPALSSVTAWLLDDGEWRVHAPVPAGTGATMRGLEVAARAAGLAFPVAEDAPRARWRRTTLTDAPSSYELPLWRP